MKPPIPKSTAPVPQGCLGKCSGKSGKPTAKVAAAVSVLFITQKQEVAGMHSDSRLIPKTFSRLSRQALWHSKFFWYV